MTLRESVINEVLKDSGALRSIPPFAINQRQVLIPKVTTLPRETAENDMCVYSFAGGLSLMRYSGGAWVQVGVPPVVTALPQSPPDGFRVAYVADGANGVTWDLRYRVAGSASYPWEFVGGAALYAEVATDQTTTSTTYAALGTAGPAVTLPLKGDYDVTIGFAAYAGSALQASMSYDIGSTGAVDADAALTTTGGSLQLHSASRRRRKTGLAAVKLTAKYLVSSATTTDFLDRWMAVTPVRVGA